MRKRSSYRPRGVIRDTIGHVLTGFKRLIDTPHATDLKLKNHVALEALRTGSATKHDVQVLIGALNMCEALAMHGSGRDWETEIFTDHDAMLAVARRGFNLGKFVCTGPELVAINLVMGVHVAQLDAATVLDLERAMATVNKVIASRKHRAVTSVGVAA